MNIILTPVEDKKRENIYVFNVRINYSRCFHRNLIIEVDDEHFHQVYLELMVFSISKNLNVFQKAYKENQLGKHFDWLKEVDFPLKNDDEIDSLTLFYYNQEREKFSVKVEGDEHLFDELWQTYDKLTDITDEPQLAIQFIEKYTLEAKLNSNKEGKKLKI
jgi:hypothetical protein